MKIFLGRKLRRRVLLLALFDLLLLASGGCASYFRSGEKTTAELEQKNQQAKEEKNMWLKPGDVIYTR